MNLDGNWWEFLVLCFFSTLRKFWSVDGGVDNKNPAIYKGFIFPEILNEEEEKLPFWSCFSSFSYSDAALPIRSPCCLCIYEIKVII